VSKEIVREETVSKETVREGISPVVTMKSAFPGDDKVSFPFLHSPFHSHSPHNHTPLLSIHP